MANAHWRIMKYDAILNYATRYAQEYFPNVAFREGTGAYDLLIKAFCILAYDLFSKLSRHLGNYAVSNWVDLPDSLVDAYASIWLLSRSPGGIATGRVRIYFSEPTAVSIPVGFRVLSNNGLRFVADNEYSFSENRMRSQREGSRYYCDITVVAEASGEEYNVGVGAITDIESAFYAPWTSITNQHAFTQGVKREDNAAFGRRITESVNTRQLIITAASAETTLRDALPTILEIDVVGFGDPAMQRDLMHEVMPGSGLPYVRVDFARKTRGNSLYNPSEAYFGSLLASSDGLPNPKDLVEELEEADQENYSALGVEDLVLATAHGGEIIFDGFDSNKASFDPGKWIWTDSGQPYGQKIYGNSIYITREGKLRLGAEDWKRATIS